MRIAVIENGPLRKTVLENGKRDEGVFLGSAKEGPLKFVFNVTIAAK